MNRFRVSLSVSTLFVALPIWALSQPTPIPPGAAEVAPRRRQPPHGL